ncbi:rootletin-like [Mizuhopecten yessoensis]|uniref:rootletin-like n=1 Tax=Mizuhopecten yessoensis TaxID=6573 RepID=UPI000B45F557|nr:rootletin-like [Mizuhopecten yessoensis]
MRYRQREAAQSEVAELETQLKLVEENRDNIRRDLIDAKIREGDEIRELMRKDMVELKRNINDEIREKDTVIKTAEELRSTVKKNECDKIDLNRSLCDHRQRGAVLEEQKAVVQKEAGDLRCSLREVERARLEARRELQDLRRQIKLLDGERNKLGNEVSDLQVRVACDEEKEEEARRHSFDLKQKVVETEASREVLRKEFANLQRKMGELADETHLKEKDYQMALEDSRRSEKKLEDRSHNLEISLEQTGAEAAELKLRLSGAEGRVNALEATLARLEGAKRDVEFKLSSIVSSLRRTIGFRQEMPRASSPTRSRTPSSRRSRPNSPTKGFESTYSTTTEGRGSPIPRTGSPERMGSPTRLGPRGASPRRLEYSREVAPLDVDPEAVRMALRDFVQQLAGAERERVSTLKDQLSTEMRKRQQYISRSSRTGDEIRDIRNILDGSLSAVTRHPDLDPLLLETETRKLDDSMDFRSTSPYPSRQTLQAAFATATRHEGYFSQFKNEKNGDY